MNSNYEHHLITHILDTKNYYQKLYIKRTATQKEIRHAYLQLSKRCHPDRNSHPNSKEAFQQINTAYSTLSTNQKAYDLNGTSVNGNEETLNEVLAQIFQEFMSGHFDTLMGHLDQMQSLNPNLSINPDSARNVFTKVRELCLLTTDCWRCAKFEIIAVYDMHEQLCNLSYFDLIGRAQLSCALSKGILTIPLAILESNKTHDNETICQLIVKLVCFVDECEQRLERGARWIGCKVIGRVK